MKRASHGAGAHRWPPLPAVLALALLWPGTAIAEERNDAPVPTILCEISGGPVAMRRHEALIEGCAALGTGLILVASGDEGPSPERSRINGVEVPPASAGALVRIIEQARAAARWRLDLYLARTVARDGSPTVDFTVCNLEPRRHFNGNFRLVLVERGAPAAVWMSRREIVRQPIEDLGEAAVVGCSLPERFALPIHAALADLAVIAVVADRDGRVQALALEPLRP